MMPDSSRVPDLPSSRRPSAAARSARAHALTLEIASESDIGHERSINEDSLLVSTSSASSASSASSRALGGEAELVLDPPSFALLAACDGMGGAAAGEVASQMTVAILEEAMLRGGPEGSPDELGRRLLRALEEASRTVFVTSRARAQLGGMGTTATACVLSGETLLIAQVGDSRAYLFRRGRLTQLTRDQTLATLMMESGQLAPEDLDSFAFRHVILQAVGTAERVEVDLRRVTVCAGDVLLLCSDGLHGPVGDAEIRALLEREPTPAAAAKALIRLALDAGGPDNVSCIVARIHGSALSLPGDELTIEQGLAAPEPPVPSTDRAPIVSVPEDEDAPPASPPRSVLGKLKSLLGR